MTQPQRRPRYKRHPNYGKPMHVTRREGDEIACICGKRWPVGEDHS